MKVIKVVLICIIFGIISGIYAIIFDINVEEIGRIKLQGYCFIYMITGSFIGKVKWGNEE